MAACSLGQDAQAQDWRKQFPKFRYGVQAVETQAAALTRYKGFGEYVKQKLGVELELFLSAEYAGVIQAIGAKQLEVMDMGASGYAAGLGGDQGRRRAAGRARPIPTGQSATMRSPSCAPTVRTRTLDDLKGKTWAWAEPNSSSGYLFPLVGFRKMGLDPEKHFGKVVFSGGHEQSIIGVLDKAYDGAVTWTNDVEKHTRGGLHMMLSRKRPQEGGHPHHLGVRADPQPGHRHPLRSSDADERTTSRRCSSTCTRTTPQVFREVVRGESQGYREVEARRLPDRGRPAEPARQGAARRPRVSARGRRRTSDAWNRR